MMKHFVMNHSHLFCRVFSVKLKHDNEIKIMKNLSYNTTINYELSRTASSVKDEVILRLEEGTLEKYAAPG